MLSGFPTETVRTDVLNTCRCFHLPQIVIRCETTTTTTMFTGFFHDIVRQERIGEYFPCGLGRETPIWIVRKDEGHLKWKWKLKTDE